ncbi:LEA type 2 family protein [Chitinophaga sp. Ak27]|uniref:LEA type 2 family protein n=1 Tax=Chitinophaga sp. Ak27 TaxID=2726116 RepID=UPI00145CBA4D|nr:LEA type 2 family protein [Chitinophaga sp. Ak27]NLU96009.1 LEA type 2 family protein [Chitinophaga sp. Ak27]
MKVRERISRATILAVIAAITLSSCSFFKTPEARLPRKLPVKVFNITPQRAALRVTGVYYNPNNYGFTFTGGELDLRLDTFYLGHVKLDTVMNIPAHATFTIPVIVEPDFAKLGNSGINMADSVVVSFSGTMAGKVGWFSKKIDIKYQGKHFLDLSF